ncbi:uncharacterized protein BCR38DRAFT_350297 [Pseudomassariella vexata]|uniref:FAD-binding PCMH-type domain-containing protein n=1 Tax=Pseudomassariella vexata TaxID=1141098 RepID=A0A1Y2DLP4_9PEZI|nr:uncharacterized protein BCR38DRAFT_350297 [Pseudomassariella vexata]ORY60056.1 hypothetical protein BCR38DRAFT_350297 [Pseudomassariella vexata]
MRSSLALVLLASVTKITCYNFDFESIQLQDEDVDKNPDVAFGEKSTPIAGAEASACRVFPGTEQWPADEAWTRLNNSLGGVLLKPAPPAAVCYPSSPSYNTAQCNYIVFNASTNRFYINDPLTVLTEWPEGSTCPATLTPKGNCTQGGFPDYVVNATTVKHIQMAVNFARNKNIRLVVKNTGHDWVGRSTGAGSLSIWTHYLKSFEFLPEYTHDKYKGVAAKVSSGIEAWETYDYMDIYNMTLVVPNGYTVGAYGGWMTGGGHSILGSIYGLGADQPLSIQAVTADGKFVTADLNNNPDLFYALRGGGPGTFAIVTSAVIKAFPFLEVTATTLAFNYRNSSTIPENDITLPLTLQDRDLFWRGFNLYNRFGLSVVDANGTAYSYATALNNASNIEFTGTFEFPGKSKTEVKKFMQPLFNELNKMGINVTNPEPGPSTNWGPKRDGVGDVPGNSRFGSRLFPRANWEDDELWEDTMRAVRETTEQGYMFHGIHVAPTEEVAGYPGQNGMNPAFRRAVMHADMFDIGSAYDNGGSRGEATPEQIIRGHELMNEALNKWRVATPDGGAYINEADVQEPDWQKSFFGSKYERLLEIKKKWDPWSLFWAPSTVGSEGWAVRDPDGLPTQNGPLCKV